MRLVQHRVQNQPFLFLLESRRGGNSGMELLPTLILETENGSCSPEMLKIYGDYKNKSSLSENPAASLKQQGGSV
jgi:tRNA1(Val) A37 N6-methylase TrmN6